MLTVTSLSLIEPEGDHVDVLNNSLYTIFKFGLNNQEQTSRFKNLVALEKKTMIIIRAITTSKGLIEDVKNLYLKERLGDWRESILTNPTLKDFYGRIVAGDEFNLNYYALADVYMQDELTFEDLNIRINPSALILTLDGFYIGHIYTWLEGNSVQAIGIRSSIRNLLNRKVKGITAIIIHALISLSQQMNLDKITVIYPIGLVPKLLQQYGFQIDTLGDYVLHTPFSNVKIETPNYSLHRF